MNNYLKIEYAILKELHDCKMNNVIPDIKNISPARFKVSDSYLLDIMEGLLDEGYIRGPLIRNTKTGRAVAGMEDIEITRKGILYLQENAAMKKVYSAMKEVRDWFPIF